MRRLGLQLLLAYLRFTRELLAIDYRRPGSGVHLVDVLLCEQHIARVELQLGITRRPGR